MRRISSDNVRSPPPADDDAGYPRRSYAWAVVAILIGTAILSYTDRQVLTLLVDPIGAICSSALPKSVCCLEPPLPLSTASPGSPSGCSPIGLRPATCSY